MDNVVFLKNPNTDEIKKLNLGFAWQVFVFNVFYFVYKKDWKWAGIFVVLLGFATMLPEDYVGFAIFLIDLLSFLFYNKIKLKELTAKGWVITENSKTILNQYRIQKAEKAQTRKEKRKAAYENLAKIESNGGIFQRQEIGRAHV